MNNPRSSGQHFCSVRCAAYLFSLDSRQHPQWVRRGRKGLKPQQRTQHPQGVRRGCKRLKPQQRTQHPQGVRRGCKGLKPQQRTQRGNDGFADCPGLTLLNDGASK